MPAVTRTRAGQWADRPLPDTRVSWGEQQDYQVPVRNPSAWEVVLLCLAAFVVIWPVAVYAIATR